jgi:four helix bundle protein
MQDFKNLKVWRNAHQLTLDVYAATQRFPPEERYGLRAQIRASSASIGINIAEGCARGSDPEFRRFLHISMGSASELEYQLLLARDLKILEGPRHIVLTEQVTKLKKMTASLIRKLKADS